MELIEREALKKHAIYLHGFGKHKYVPLKVIDAAPTIDAAPVVHGRWIQDVVNLYGCSECMERETMSPKKPKLYCPNCGARMGGKGHG